MRYPRSIESLGESRRIALQFCLNAGRQSSGLDRFQGMSISRAESPDVAESIGVYPLLIRSGFPVPPKRLKEAKAVCSIGDSGDR